VDIPSLPDAPQEFSSGLDSELMKLTKKLHNSNQKGI
jgi:hypothetical protein